MFDVNPWDKIQAFEKSATKMGDFGVDIMLNKFIIVFQ
jgi:hypothetical protein